MNALDLTDLDENIETSSFHHFSRVDNIFCSSKIADENQIVELKKYDIKKVIDLKLEDETPFNDRERITRSGLDYIYFPVSDLENIDFESLQRFSEHIESSDHNILIYCMSANRVGAMLSLYLSKICGHPKKRAIEIGSKMGMKRESLQEKLKEIINYEETAI